MPRINVYLPEDLATEAREAGLNLSALLQDALRRALAQQRMNAWLEEVAALGATGVRHKEVVDAVRAARKEFGHA